MTGFPALPPHATLPIATQGQTSTTVMPQQLSAASSGAREAPPHPSRRSPTSALIASRIIAQQRSAGTQPDVHDDESATSSDDYRVPCFLDEFKRDTKHFPTEWKYAQANAKELASLARKLNSFPANAPAHVLAKTLKQTTPEALRLLVRHPWLTQQTKETIQKELDTWALLNSFMANAPAKTFDEAASEGLQLLARHPWAHTQIKERIQEELHSRDEFARDLTNRDIPSLFELARTKTGVLKKLAEKELRRREENEDLKKNIATIEVLPPSEENDMVASALGGHTEQIFLKMLEKSVFLTRQEEEYARTNAKELESLALTLESFLAGAPGNALATTLDQAPSEALQLLVRHPWVPTQTQATIQKELNDRDDVVLSLTNCDISYLSKLASTKTGALKELAEKELRRRAEDFS
jgi:hypothetical protein